MRWFNRLVDWIVARIERDIYSGQFLTLCTVRGAFTYSKQQRYDVEAGEWVFTDETVEVRYVLKYTDSGDRKYDVQCGANWAINRHKETEEYLNVVEPWVNGQLRAHDIMDLFKQQPERFLLPGTLRVLPKELRASFKATSTATRKQAAEYTNQKQIAYVDVGSKGSAGINWELSA